MLRPQLISSRLDLKGHVIEFVRVTSAILIPYKEGLKPRQAQSECGEHKACAMTVHTYWKQNCHRRPYFVDNFVSRLSHKLPLLATHTNSLNGINMKSYMKFRLVTFSLFFPLRQMHFFYLQRHCNLCSLLSMAVRLH